MTSREQMTMLVQAISSKVKSPVLRSLVKNLDTASSLQDGSLLPQEVDKIKKLVDALNLVFEVIDEDI